MDGCIHLFYTGCWTRGSLCVDGRVKSIPARIKSVSKQRPPHIQLMGLSHQGLVLCPVQTCIWTPVFTALSQGRRFLLLGDWLKGWDTLHNFLPLELPPPPLSLRAGQATHWTGSAVHVKKKCGLAVMIGQMIDPRGKGELSQTESSPSHCV